MCIHLYTQISVQVVKRSILDNPLIFNLRSETSTQQRTVLAVLSAKLQSVNPVLKQYESMLERGHETHGLAVLPEDSIANIVRLSQARDPILGFRQYVRSTAMYLAVNEAPTIPQQLPKADECIGEAALLLVLLAWKQHLNS